MNIITAKLKVKRVINTLIGKSEESTQLINRIDSSIFKYLFSHDKHIATSDLKTLKSSIVKLANKIDHQQPGYHPVYGFTEDFGGKRFDLLERNCQLVLKKLEHIKTKHQVRILDVGCNNGYVACRLAEVFPNTIGIEIANDRVELCKMIATYTDSSARFFNVDFIETMKSGDEDLENIDVVLLFNVVHQFIFNIGYKATKAILARMMSRIDYAFVELAHKKDYISHNKDHLLPLLPEDVLSECHNHEIVLIADNPRPVYFIKRKKIAIGQMCLDIKQQVFGQSHNPNTSRKYYASDHHFVKIFRFTEDQSQECVHREINSLLSLRDYSWIPKIYDWHITPSYGWVLMERIHGTSLVGECFGNKLLPSQRFKFTLEYFNIAISVFKSIGFHNDLQPHNFIVSDNKLMLIDFEQSFEKPRNDPFGLLLWSIFDIWGGRDPHRKEAIVSLRPVNEDGLRSDEPIYPDFSRIKIPSKISEMVSDALVAVDWLIFLEYWQNVFSSEEGKVDIH